MVTKYFLIMLFVASLALQSFASASSLDNSNTTDTTGSTPYTVEELEKIKADKLAFLESLQDLEPLTRAQKFNEFLEEEKKSRRLSNTPSKEEREIATRNSRLESINLAISNLESGTKEKTIQKDEFSTDKLNSLSNSKSEIDFQIKPLLLKRLKLEKEHIDSPIEKRAKALSEWDRSQDGQKFRDLNEQLKEIRLQEDLNVLEECLKDLNSDDSSANKFFKNMKDGEDKKRRFIDSLNRQINKTKETLQQVKKPKGI